MSKEFKQRSDIFWVDKDVFYLKLVQEVGASRGIPIDCFKSLNAMDLVDMTGRELSSCCSTFLIDMPIILTNGSVRRPSLEDGWPRNVIAFIRKTQGPTAILQLASAVARARCGYPLNINPREIHDDSQANY